MIHAIRVHQAGGPEVLQWEEIDVGEPGPGQVRLKQEAAGLNYIDVYHRTGLYPQPILRRTEAAAKRYVETIRPYIPAPRTTVTATTAEAN